MAYRPAGSEAVDGHAQGAARSCRCVDGAQDAVYRGGFGAVSEAEAVSSLLRLAVCCLRVVADEDTCRMCRMGVGYDRLDRVALAARGVTVCNVPGKSLQFREDCPLTVWQITARPR
jgi:hypothetical protein